jgi:hypothetical protein
MSNDHRDKKMKTRDRIKSEDIYFENEAFSDNNLSDLEI